MRHGYYQVGNCIIANKIEAIFESEKNSAFPYFIFNDQSYAMNDWTVEPVESLDQLYANRAWELRKKYDYLILHFSGGSDSTNILETFINHKIPLDEIFIRGPWKVADKNINNHNASNQHAESWFTAWPLANWAKDTHYPHLKITVTDTTQYLVDYFTNNPNWHEKFKMSALAPGVIWKSDYDLVEKSYSRLSDKGIKAAHILGVEKPMVFFHNKRYHVKFLDRILNIMLGQRCSDQQNPYHVEAFYWSDTTAKLLIKQAHTIKNFIKKNKIDPSILSTQGRTLHEWLANIIYKRTLPLFFTTEKSPYQALLMDQFFFQDRESIHMKNFQKGLQSLSSILPDRWKETTPFMMDLVGVWSREYDIGL